jgi:glycosyltransferase involved in cell wall biosynthesis
VAAQTFRAGVFTYDYLPAIGGGGRHVVEVCKRLPAGEVVVFSGQRNDLEDHRSVWPGLPHGFVKQLLLSVWLNLRIRTHVRRLALKAVNVHSGPGGLFLVRSAGVPLIVTAHHTYAQQVERLPSQFWKRLFIPFERSTLRRADKVICVSEDTQRAVVERYGIAREKTVVIPNGIDTAVFRPQPDVERTQKSVLFLSRLEKRKGVDFLLRAMRLVASEDKSVKLFIGGKGSLAPTLKSYVAENGLSEQVEFLGFVPDVGLPSWYARVGCFVMPSVFEGFGIPVLEAMACGTPVIGTNVDGIRGLIDDGKTGLLVDFGDETGLAERILRVCGGGFTPPTDLAERIRENYDWDGVAERYAGLLL